MTETQLRIKMEKKKNETKQGGVSGGDSWINMDLREKRKTSCFVLYLLLLSTEHQPNAPPKNVAEWHWDIFGAKKFSDCPAQSVGSRVGGGAVGCW